MPGKPWQPWEDATIKREWHDISMRTLKQKLPGRSIEAIKLRARRKHKLHGGIPQGCESISELARLLGYTRKLMLKILRWAGVAVKKYEYKYTSTRRCADYDDARIAALKWERSETIEQAKRRLHVGVNTMWRWLRSAGVNLRSYYRKHGRPFRADPSVYNKIAMKRRRVEVGAAPISHVARFLGVPTSSAKKAWKLYKRSRKKSAAIVYVSPDELRAALVHVQSKGMCLPRMGARRKQR